MAPVRRGRLTETARTVARRPVARFRRSAPAGIEGQSWTRIVSVSRKHVIGDVGVLVVATDVAKRPHFKLRHHRRLSGLLDGPRPGAPRELTDAAVERAIPLTMESTPRDATHWSTRAMAMRCGLSQTTVSRIGRTFAPTKSW